MRSIRRTLSVWLVIVVVVLGALAAAACYARASVALADDFDRSLLAQATALEAAVHREPEGTLAVIDAAVPAGQVGRFQIWDATGRSRLRSDPADNRDLAVPDSPDAVHFWTVSGADGDTARAVRVRFLPGLETEQDGENDGRPTSNPSSTPVARSASAAIPDDGARVTLVLEQDLKPVRRMQQLILSSLAVALAGLCGGVLVAVPLVVKRGLASVGRLADQAGRIDATSLATRFETAGVPDELRPICDRLNDLLGRLESAFQRERRFTGNVAHELRTPVAELRTIAEVALRWPGDAAATATGFGDVLAVSLRMEAVVTALLSLARGQAGTARPAAVPVDLNALVVEAWTAVSARAAARDVSIAFQLPTPAVVPADPTLTRTMVGNLLSNAAAYCPPAGIVRCAVTVTEGMAEVAIENPAGDLAPADLPLLTEAFWRKDVAGTDAAHAGLGLSLVAAYAKVTGVGFDVSLTDDGQFRARLRFP